MNPNLGRLSRPALVLLFLAMNAGRLTAAEPPKPFTPIKATPKEFRCLGRVMELGDLLLPAQITAAGQPLLAAPIRIFSEPNILSAVTGKAKVIERNDESARWEWKGESADFSLTSTMRADCDGFCWYEIQIAPKHPLKLRSLGLEIPRRSKTARYLHTANYTWSNTSGGLAELGGTWHGPFIPYLWLGDEERGLAWCAESTEGWRLRHPSAALKVETRGEVVSFKTTWLDHEESFSAPIVFRFGLQAGLVKPVSFAWRANARMLHDIHYESCRPGPDGRCELDRLRDGGVKTAVIHDSWTAYFGQMVPADAAQLRRLLEACHQRGLRLLVYVGYGTARKAPEMRGKHDEWSVLPLMPWESPQYKPDQRGFDAACANSGWADWLVASADKLFTDFDLDGLYFDGTTAAWACQNQAHGCGWKDEQDQVHPGYPMLAARRLMRRLADTVHRHKPGAILDAHMSSNFTLPTLAFCDSVWNGEQLSADKSLASFRAQFMGYAQGLDAEFLCRENHPFTFDEAIALAGVHGIEVRPYPTSLSKVTPIWRVMDRFGVSKARWLPYWSESVATADSDAVRVSAWTRNGKALLFVSHLERKAATVRLQLDARKLGLKKFKATDTLRETPLAMDHDTLELNFSGMSYCLIELD